MVILTLQGKTFPEHVYGVLHLYCAEYFHIRHAKILPVQKLQDGQSR
ncbi:MAG: hypothetical protein KDD04_08710 [Sinomicrobium sp.]|nr:hypothetical protein [Sinomicrobium sp.]